jgi:hypothetical protein
MALIGKVNDLTVAKGGGNVATNTAVGADALNVNTTGADNTAVGYQAMDANTTGIRNTAVGSNALGANTTGTENTAFGRQALLKNTTASSSVAIGQDALRENTTGAQNTAVGTNALVQNTTGAKNTAVGYQAGFSLTTGEQNIAVGNEALLNATTCLRNVCVGDSAGRNVTTGRGNTFIGGEAGYFCTTGAGNTLINPQTDGGYSPAFEITSENNRFVAGSSSVTNAYVKVAWTVTSDARDKTSIEAVPHGLSFVNQLNPVSYRWKTSRENETPTGNKRYGFLAQDILALEGDNPVIIDNEKPDHLKYQGEALVPVLVNAIKELSAQVTALQAEFNALKGQ